MTSHDDLAEAVKAGDMTIEEFADRFGMTVRQAIDEVWTAIKADIAESKLIQDIRRSR